MKFGRFVAMLSANRWPLYLGGLLVMSIVAEGILVFSATRPDAPRPMKDYYQQAARWDQDAAIAAESRRLGWAVDVDVPSGPEVVAAAGPRPVDVVIRDRDGHPVTGLAGDVHAIRASDGRLNATGTLTELPQQPGRYRTLLTLAAPGLWELDVEARREGVAFVHRVRVTVDGGVTP
jgi:hypothetical protein